MHLSRIALLSEKLSVFSRAKYILLIILIYLYSSSIWAHAKLLTNSDVPPRYDNPGIKGADPCGSESGVKTGVISNYPRGATVKVEWLETVDHYGYFQVDFSTDGGTSFVNPVTVDDPIGSTKHQFAISYTLPDQLCGAGGCLLRMRQYMASTQTFYFSCADVVLNDPDLSPQDPATSLSISANTNDVLLSWSNPTQAKGLLVLRDTQDQFGSLNLSDLTVYHVNDSVNGAKVLFTSDNSVSQFSDTQFSGDTDYYYAVYAFSDSYVYSSPVASVVHTLVGSSGGGGTSTSTSSSNTTSNDSAGAGDPIGVLALALFTVLVSYRKSQQLIRARIREQKQDHL